MKKIPLIIALFVLIALAGGCFLVSPQPEDGQEADAQAGAAAPRAEAGTVSSAEEEKRSPEEDRRRTHLNVIRLSVDVRPEPRIRITVKKHPSTISKYSEEREISGGYYLTKQGVLLCEAGPCTFRWAVKFTYTDEAGRADAFLLQCSATVYGGMTPSGTGKSKLDWCINGDCEHFRDLCLSDVKTQLARGRYGMSLAGPSLIVRRNDISSEIVDGGRKLTDY